MKYLTRNDFSIDVGFSVVGSNVADAVALTNDIMVDLPSGLYKCLDFKTISSMIGAIFCDALASKTDGIVNPIEKGHPDLVPSIAATATEAELRNYPTGLEVKCTVGNVEQGAKLRAGQKRIGRLTGITWQAHHREVKELMGMVWDFANDRESFNYPAIIGVFYTTRLQDDDWGAISGTTGRNTKVTGMLITGKRKMGSGWVLLLDEPEYLRATSRLLCFDSPRQ